LQVVFVWHIGITRSR